MFIQENEGEQKKMWSNKRIGITGASGSLGKELSRAFASQGGYVIGLTHQSNLERMDISNGPSEWVQWECGKEANLHKILETLDLLVLNHGINPGGNLNVNQLNKSIEVNALSTWRLIESFEKVVMEGSSTKELWVNTSEAEIQPAFSPSYEISKRLIGQLVSFKYSSQTNKERTLLKIRKLILGPFRSKLNPIGIMNSAIVAKKILSQSKKNSNLIIVSPNPITYLLMPMIERIRNLYFEIFKDKE